MTRTARRSPPHPVILQPLWRCASSALLCLGACDSQLELSSRPDAASLSDAGSVGMTLDGTVRPPIDAATPRDPIDATAAPQGADAGSRDGAAEALAQRLDQLAQSRRAWEALASASAGPYWYEEENCALNSVRGRSSVVQIDADGGYVAELRTFARTECQALVNRYGDLRSGSSGQAAPPLLELYAQCATQLSSRPDSTLTFDARGVVKDCWVGDAPRCKDNCGSGFSLRQWGFGTAQRAADAGVASDAGR